MKKLGIALLAISMCFACGDAEEVREALAEGEYENLEDAYTRDNAALDALDRCDIAAATVYNDTLDIQVDLLVPRLLYGLRVIYAVNP